MGYVTDIMLSIPMGIVIYMLVGKLIDCLTRDNSFSDKVQKSFVIGFCFGMGMIGLGMTMFAEHSNINNRPLRFALYGAGGLMGLGTIVFNWDVLDESTKTMILGICAVGLVGWSYSTK